MPTHGGSDINKYLSQEEKNTLKLEFAYQGQSFGMIGGYCEEGFPLYYANEDMAALLGYESVEELAAAIGGRVVNTIHPDDMAQVENDLGGRFYEGMTYETTYRMLRRDGSWFWTVDKGKVVRAEDGRLAILSVCTDMSDFLHRQKELESQNSVSNYLFRNLPDGTFLQCILSDVSRFVAEREQREAELERLLKASEERYEIIRALGTVYQDISVIDLKAQRYTLVSGCGKSEQYQGSTGPSGEFRSFVLNEIIAPAQHEEAAVFLDFSTAAERLREKRFIAREFKGQNGAWCLVTLIVKSRDENGNVTHLLVSARNIDEQKTKELEYQKNLEEAAAEAHRANEAKTNFLRRMSHDIRTPLNGIIGLLKIDETHFDDPTLVRENHKKMAVAADHLPSLINDVLQMSKLDDGKAVLTHEFISLIDLTQDIVSIIIGRTVEAGVEWDYEKGKAVIPYPYIYGSPVHLRQIFLNIYGNCIKYNRPGGKITTIVDVLEEHDGMCTYRWTIIDTGIGMSQDFLQHIFEPFAQEKSDARSAYQGAGLGMPIVKGLLDQMGGTIDITSEVGVGSTFVIAIPFEIAPAPEVHPAKKTAAAGDIRGLHLLLAEDNDLNAEIAQVFLSDQGAKVTTVSDGRQAVDRFQLSAPGTFDTILMDIMMPVMDGYAATGAIRALPRADAKSIPIIAMTANAFKEGTDRCLAAGMNAHLAKPLQINEVVTAIAHCFCKEP